MSLSVVKRYSSVREYNEAHPDLPFPSQPGWEENHTAVLLAVEHGNDDFTIDFLPGGADGNRDTVGNLVACSYSGGGPVFLLAQSVQRYAAVATMLTSRRGDFLTLEGAAKAGVELVKQSELND